MDSKTGWSALILRSIVKLQDGGRVRRAVGKKLISKDIGISTDYIEQLAVPLKSIGWVTTTRGPRGGYNVVIDELSYHDLREVTEAVQRRKGKFENDWLDGFVEGRQREVDGIDSMYFILGGESE